MKPTIVIAGHSTLKKHDSRIKRQAAYCPKASRVIIYVKYYETWGKLSGFIFFLGLFALIVKRDLNI